MRSPRLAIAAVLIVLVALASTMSYTAYLVIGVLAEFLGIGRFTTGLLLAVLFARLPWFSKGKFRTVGLLPAFARRPVVISLLALCCLSFVSRGMYVPALFTGFATAFLLSYPLIRRRITGRMVSSVFGSARGRKSADSSGASVIDVEFTEKKD